MFQYLQNRFHCRNILFVPLLILMITLGLAGCDLNNSNGDRGHMKVSMTDAPAHYDAVFIDVQKVEAHMEGEAENSGWVKLSSDPMKINLLELTNGETKLIGSADLKTGHYDQIRLVLGSDNSVNVDGETHTLVTPSAQESGYKLNIDSDVSAESDLHFVIDFDAGRSILLTAIGDFKLHPVLRIFEKDKQNGSISGTISPEGFQSQVLAINNADTAATMADTTGSFKIVGLEQAAYKLTINPKSTQYSDTTLTDVQVQENQNTDIGTIQLN